MYTNNEEAEQSEVINKPTTQPTEPLKQQLSRQPTGGGFQGSSSRLTFCFGYDYALFTSVHCGCLCAPPVFPYERSGLLQFVTQLKYKGHISNSFQYLLATPLNEFYSSLPNMTSLLQPCEELGDEVFGLLLDIVLWEPLRHYVGDLKKLII